MLIVNALRDTLGLSRTQLANVLVHFSYDGVYASKEQRTDGGGSLDLPNHVSEAHGLPRNTLTETWDY